MRRRLGSQAAVLGLGLGLMAALDPAAALGPTPPLGRQVAARPDAEPVARTSSVRSLYIVHCAGCHGRDGAGTLLGGVPDMRQAGRFLHLPGGRSFLIRVPGVMGAGLDDAQVADVTNYVLGTLAAASLPPGHQPYRAEEVRAARGEPLLDVAAERKRLQGLAREAGLPID